MGAPLNQPLILSAVSQAIVDDATTNGDCFVPQAGNSIAVVLDSGVAIQWNVLEFTLPATGAFAVLAPKVESNGQITLKIQIPVNATAELQASSDLKTWTPVGNVINSQGQLEFKTNVDLSAYPRLFLRAVRH